MYCPDPCLETDFLLTSLCGVVLTDSSCQPSSKTVLAEERHLIWSHVLFSSPSPTVNWQSDHLTQLGTVGGQFHPQSSSEAGWGFHEVCIGCSSSSASIIFILSWCQTNSLNTCCTLAPISEPTFREDQFVILTDTSNMLCLKLNILHGAFPSQTVTSNFTFKLEDWTLFHYYSLWLSVTFILSNTFKMFPLLSLPSAAVDQIPIITWQGHQT